MTTGSPGERAVAALEVSDIFIVSSQCKVQRDFNPTGALEPVSYQSRILPEEKGFFQTRTLEGSGEQIHVVRYFIDCSFRILKPDVEVTTQDLSANDLLAEISATFAVDYTCAKEFMTDAEAIGAFSSNAVFHAWPYWRETIHSLTARMRLPRVTLPMMRAGKLPMPADTPKREPDVRESHI